MPKIPHDKFFDLNKTEFRVDLSEMVMNENVVMISINNGTGSHVDLNFDQTNKLIKVLKRYRNIIAKENKNRSATGFNFMSNSRCDCDTADGYVCVYH